MPGGELLPDIGSGGAEGRVVRVGTPCAVAAAIGHVAVGRDNHAVIGVLGDDVFGPAEHLLARRVLEAQSHELQLADLEECVVVRVAAAVAAAIPGLARETALAEPGVELAAAAVPPAAREVIVVPRSHRVGNPLGVEHVVRRIRNRPLRRRIAVGDVPHVQHEPDVVRLLVVDNPLHLLAVGVRRGIGLLARVVLGVGKQNERERVAVVAARRLAGRARGVARGPRRTCRHRGPLEATVDRRAHRALAHTAARALLRPLRAAGVVAHRSRTQPRLALLTGRTPDPASTAVIRIRHRIHAIGAARDGPRRTTVVAPFHDDRSVGRLRDVGLHRAVGVHSAVEGNVVGRCIAGGCVGGSAPRSCGSTLRIAAAGGRAAQNGRDQGGERWTPKGRREHDDLGGGVGA